MKEKGYVYILTNPSFKEEWIKIGYTQNMEERLRTLDNTSTPLPFEKYAVLETSKYKEVEQLIHKLLDEQTDFRIRDRREFFNLDPEKALNVFKGIKELYPDAEIIEFCNQAPKGQANINSKPSSSYTDSPTSNTELSVTPFTTNIDEVISSRKPARIYIGSNSYNVKTWQEVFITFVKYIWNNPNYKPQLLIEGQTQLSKRNVVITNKKNLSLLIKNNKALLDRYKNFDGEILSKSKTQDDNDIYIHTNISASTCIKRIASIMNIYDISKDVIKITISK